ncbi:MAG: four helix bundle protein, partial [Bacteroidaceae bacterium]|nr:four helix bundle protein [Bacteroidaceae bacterium]
MINYKREGSILHIKSYKFADRIVKMYLHLKGDHKLEAIYTQILRSGTSVSANIHESEFAQSKADFITKLSIALKEANETMNWLNLLKDNSCITEKEFTSMANDCSEIIALLVASIKTSKNKDGINNNKTTQKKQEQP